MEAENHLWKRNIHFPSSIVVVPCYILGLQAFCECRMRWILLIEWLLVMRPLLMSTMTLWRLVKQQDIVDGSEIRRSPVEVVGLSHYLQGFIHPRWLFGISEPPTVGEKNGSLGEWHTIIPGRDNDRGGKSALNWQVGSRFCGSLGPGSFSGNGATWWALNEVRFRWMCFFFVEQLFFGAKVWSGGITL